MPRIFASTAFRFAAFFSMAFILLTAALGAGMYVTIHDALRYDLDQRIVTERAAVLHEAAGAGLARIVADRFASEHGDMRYALLDPAGHLVAGQRLVLPVASGWSSATFFKKNGEPDPTRIWTGRTADGDTLIVGADPEAIESLDEVMVPLFIGAFGFVAAIGVGGAFLLGRMLRDRLEAIDRTASGIIAGDLSQRVTVSGRGDEFDRLAAMLNQMLDRIAALLGNLRQVSGDIAHDLRTPLTRLRQKLELALAASDNDAPALRDAIGDAIEQTDDMLALFGAILSISEVEAGGAGIRRERLDLSALVADLADSYQPSIEDAGHSLSRDIAPGVAVEGSRELLAQLGVNLLDNALRHTPVGTGIAVQLTADGDDAVLVVADRGPGIPLEERRRVFDRFTRLERSRSTPGHGLGLSLVAAIARAHGGDVRIDDNNPGVKMLVRLPRAGR